MTNKFSEEQLDYIAQGSAPAAAALAMYDMMQERIDAAIAAGNAARAELQRIRQAMGIFENEDIVTELEKLLRDYEICRNELILSKQK